MAIAALDRFAGPSIYSRVDDVRRYQSTAALRAVDDGTTGLRTAAPAETRPVAAPSTAIESLTSSARAATVALAVAPQIEASNLAGARAATSAAQDAALAALADPLETPSPRQVAENFAAVAALVPSPQQLVNAAASDGAADDAVAAPEAVANDQQPATLAFAAGDYPGTRLSRYA